MKNKEIEKLDEKTLKQIQEFVSYHKKIAFESSIPKKENLKTLEAIVKLVNIFIDYNKQKETIMNTFK